MRFFPARSPRTARPSERGIALAVTMVVMVILTMLGVVLLLRNDTNQMMAKNERDVATCRQAAEAALRQGIDMATANLYKPVTFFSTAIDDCIASTSPDCTKLDVDLGPDKIVDHPGALVSNPAWVNKLFIAGATPVSNVYVTIYIRNNADDVQSAVNTQSFVDTDGIVTIVGEAEMTTDGTVPTANRSNVRVRKMIAAEIRVNAGGTSNAGKGMTNSWNTGAAY